MQSVYDRLSPMWEKSLSVSGDDDALRVYDRLPVSEKNSLRLYVLGLSRSHLIRRSRPPRRGFPADWNILTHVQLYLLYSYHFKLVSGPPSGTCNLREIMCNECMWNLIMGVLRSLILISRRIIIACLGIEKSTNRNRKSQFMNIKRASLRSSGNLERSCWTTFSGRG